MFDRLLIVFQRKSIVVGLVEYLPCLEFFA
jgi:hypothetical protein